MPALSVFGAQWGDEGKGKIIDHLARERDLVVRYQGGANAGHTVIVGGEKYVLHLVPSGILHPAKRNVIASGVAVDPVTLEQEIEGLRARGIEVGPDRLRVSAGAHVIFEHHRRIERMAEGLRGALRIGTTGRGIGPCYADKAARTGLRMADLADREVLARKLPAVLAEKNSLLERVLGEPPLAADEELERYAAAGERLRPFVCDAGAEVRRAWREGLRILFEGAQGLMLDLDHGTYPYVTSSSTGVHGIGPGVGFPPAWIDRAWGIAKAYCTRVGEGPFPTEDHGEDGATLREVGREYGATTGRPRRCGWFDAVVVRYALELCGADAWVVTNLDVLSAFREIPVATAYEVGGRRVREYPAGLSSLEGVRPVYESLPGWMDDITGVRHYGDLPAAARAYVERLEELVGAPAVLLSVGPERDQVVPRADSTR